MSEGNPLVYRNPNVRPSLFHGLSRHIELPHPRFFSAFLEIDTSQSYKLIETYNLQLKTLFYMFLIRNPLMKE